MSGIGQHPEGGAARADRHTVGRSRRVMAWIALYPIGWGALFFVSTAYWFLPAGLRLGMLWVLPRRHWWKMAVVEWIGILILSLTRGAFNFPLTLIASTLLPWSLYAAIVAQLRRRASDRALHLGGMMPRVVLAGAIAALATASALTLVDWADGDSPRRLAGWGNHLFSYLLGDFVGVLIVAPLLLVTHELLGKGSRDWRRLTAGGVVALPAAIAIAFATLPIREAPIYALMLSLFPLFWCAFRFGWRTSAVALALLSVGVYAFGHSLFALWQPQQLQLLISAAGCGAMLLGISTDALRAQRETLGGSVTELSRRGRQLTDAGHRLASLQEDERRRIGLELHDQIGQDMTAIATRLRVVERTATERGVQDGLASISLLVADAHTHLREVIHRLHPVVLDRFGLARALSEGPLAEMLRDHGIEHVADIDGDIDQLNEATAIALYRICQEAANNCVQHVGQGQFRVAIALLEGPHDLGVSLSIDDDGGEVPLYRTRTGRGLKSIADRADALGAAYQFNLQSGKPRHALLLRLPPLPTADAVMSQGDPILGAHLGAMGPYR